MVTLEFKDTEIDMLWTVFIEKSCDEFMRMQNSKTATDLLRHKQSKEICDNIIEVLKPYRF